MMMRDLVPFRNDLNPWRDLADLQREVSRLFDDFGSSSRRGLSSTVNYAPTCDVHETDSHYLMSFDIPGVSKKDIKIEIVNNQLIVSGRRSDEAKEESGTRHILEKTYGEFQRSFSFPSAIESDKVEANYENGVLQLAVPKAEAARPKRIEIHEGTGGIFQKLIDSSKKTIGLTTEKNEKKETEKVA